MDEKQESDGYSEEAREMGRMSREFDEIVEHNEDKPTRSDKSIDEKQTEEHAEKQSEKQPTPQQSGGAGLIVLQWLTYAFWGWTLLFVLYLIALVFGSMLTSVDTSSQVPYAIAGALVLLPISFLCDLFYGRREPVKKSGGSMVVMIIHAVIFALCGIGVLIGSVLTFVQLLVNTPSDPSASLTTIYTLLVGSVLYAMTFVRTLNPLPKLHITKWYKIAMLLVVGGFIVAAFVGPVAKSWTSRDDRDIVSNLYYVSEATNRYIKDYKKLPTSLKDVDMEAAGKNLVDRGLVTYKSDGVTLTDSSDVYYEDKLYGDVPYDFKYQLCVTYKTKYEMPTSLGGNKDFEGEYRTSLYIYDHPAGRVCYKLRAVVEQSRPSGAQIYGLQDMQGI